MATVSRRGFSCAFRLFLACKQVSNWAAPALVGSGHVGWLPITPCAGSASNESRSCASPKKSAAAAVVGDLTQLEDRDLATQRRGDLGVLLDEEDGRRRIRPAGGRSPGPFPRRSAAPGPRWARPAAARAGGPPAPAPPRPAAALPRSARCRACRAGRPASGKASHSSLTGTAWREPAAIAASSRFCRTLSRPKIRRSSGTQATPRRAICSTLSRLTSRPSSITCPVAPDAGSHDRAQGAGLPGPVAAEQADDLPGFKTQVHLEEDLGRPVPGGQAGDGQRRGGHGWLTPR